MNLSLSSRLLTALSLCAFINAGAFAADAPKPPFDVPERYGTITDYHPGRGSHTGQIIVLLQDLHANVGVQKNIAAILYRLRKMNKNTMLLVCVEGASGEGDVSLLRSLPGPVRHGFEAMLLHKAYLTGAELAATEAASDWPQQQNVLWYKVTSLFSSQPPPAPVSLSPINLWGVDDPDLYRKNWHAAKVVDRQSTPTLAEMRNLKSMLLTGASGPLEKQLPLMTKLLMLRLQPSEYQDYLKGRALNPKGSALFQSSVVAAETYYQAAQLRSAAMAKNLLDKMGDQPGITGLVTGGFHTKEIADILKTKGYSYMVITPEVKVLDQEAAYRARLREEE